MCQSGPIYNLATDGFSGLFNVFYQHKQRDDMVVQVLKDII